METKFKIGDKVEYENNEFEIVGAAIVDWSYETQYKLKSIHSDATIEPIGEYDITLIKESEDKMTILDLINKSVTDETMPEKVKYHGKEYEYDKEINDYRYRYINFDDDYLFDETRHLLDEVKIIDDRTDKKAEVMASLEELVDYLMGYGE